MQKYVVLSGGVGGTKLVSGLTSLPVNLSVVVNTGDDFHPYGLPVCPDLDTLLYTLSGRVHPEQGWGRSDERFTVRSELEQLGEKPWFILGDRDIALHLLRARCLSAGWSLTETIEHIRKAMGINSSILPMTDFPAPTRLETHGGWLDFQDYFVRERCHPVVRSIEYGGVGAPASPAVLAALEADDLDGIIICPSNPLLSIGPILAIDAIRSLIENRRVPSIAVSPLIKGQAVKGPTAKLYQELGRVAGAAEIARAYRGLIDILVIDTADADQARNVEATGVKVICTPTLMKNSAEKRALARLCIDELAAIGSPTLERS